MDEWHINTSTEKHHTDKDQFSSIRHAPLTYRQFTSWSTKGCHTLHHGKIWSDQGMIPLCHYKAGNVIRVTMTHLKNHVPSHLHITGNWVLACCPRKSTCYTDHTALQCQHTNTTIMPTGRIEKSKWAEHVAISNRSGGQDPKYNTPTPRTV